MFFTQVLTDEVDGPVVVEQSCECCGQNSLQLRGLTRYLAVELFDLPIITLNRRFELSCSCGHSQEADKILAQNQQLKRKVIPIYDVVFKNIGLLLLGVFLLYYFQQSLKQQVYEQFLVNSPQANDYYFIDYYRFDSTSHPKFRYTTLKAIEIKGEQITVQVSRLAKSRKVSARHQIKSDRAMLAAFFSDKTLTLSKQQLAELVDKEIIYELRRPKGYKIDGWFVMQPPEPEKFEYQYNKDNQEGISLFRGEQGYTRDYVAAFEAFTKAAIAGDASGQSNLAEMYRDGLGTERDTSQALYWFKQAAVNGHKEAQQSFDALCKQVNTCLLEEI